MKIALIGYGKMGKTIEDLAIQRGHEIVGRITSENTIESLNFDDVDVAIEFTAPHFAVKHIEKCVLNNTPVVVGTTAWNDSIDYVKEFVTQHNGSLLYASNFSVGVNIFFDINRRLAKLMSLYPSYNVLLEEIHHTEKLDSPSGTAVTLANDILFENPGISSWIHENGKKPNLLPGQLGVVSYREPNVPGTHIVSYDSEVDIIEIKHTAHNRKGFALGAVVAAEWLLGRNGIFTMQDVIKFEE